MIAVIVILLVAIVWVLGSRRLSRRSVTAPIVLSLAGWALSSGSHPVIDVNVDASSVRVAASATLALVLFADASTIGFGWFLSSGRWPSQLLLIGLPLTIAAGWLAGWALLGGMGLELAAIGVIAAALSPTDAALGSAVLEDRRIPERIRRTINVESGLNDGLATPIVLLFISLAGGVDGEHTPFAVELAVGVGIGLAVGAIGGWALHQADRLRWSLRDEEPIAALCLALLAYLVAVQLHGNGFIAAFVAGIAFGARMAQREGRHALTLTHEVGLLLGFVVWFLFGAVLLPIALDGLSWQVVAYAALSLTAVRMIPVALASIGVRADGPSVALVGWLGPRGLASIVFAILALEQLPADVADPIVQVIGVTVGLSVLAHGLSARWAAGWFLRRES